MLSQASRQEILRKINSKTGYPVNEAVLSPAVKQAITNLATVQRTLFIVTEVLRGEQGRVDGSFVLSAAARLRKDPGRAERDALREDVNRLQAEIEVKILDIASQILAEDSARQSGQAIPLYKGQLRLTQLRCPSCGAPLPIPTTHFVQCQYCKATVTIHNVSTQLAALIQNI